MLEYPMAWKNDTNKYHKIFLNNMMKSIINNDISLSTISIGWPAYGIQRSPLNNTILLAFHSYENPENVWSFKESPIHGLYSIDKSGYSGWSDICIHYENYEERINQISDENAEAIILNYQNKIKSGMTKYKQPEIDHSLPDEFVFFPLQVRTDSVAEKTYLDSLDVLERLSTISFQLKKYIVVKKHPWCKSNAVRATLLKLAQENPYLIISNSEITHLITQSKAVLAGNSGVSLEALISGKPVFCFGESEWSRVTQIIQSLDDVHLVFEKPVYNQNIPKLLAFLLSEYWVSGSNYAQINRRILEIYQCYQNVSEHSFTNEAELNLKLEKKITKYQQQYTLKYNDIREVVSDYQHLKKIEADYSRLKKIEIENHVLMNNESEALRGPTLWQGTVIKTNYSRYLCFNRELNLIFSATAKDIVANQAYDLFRVKHLENHLVLIYIIHQGRVYYLSMDSKNVTDELNLASRFTLKIKDNTLSLCADCGRYLSSNPDGAVFFDRNKALAWECFYLKTIYPQLEV